MPGSSNSSIKRTTTDNHHNNWQGWRGRTQKRPNQLILSRSVLQLLCTNAGCWLAAAAAPHLSHTHARRIEPERGVCQRPTVRAWSFDSSFLCLLRQHIMIDSGAPSPPEPVRMNDDGWGSLWNGGRAITLTSAFHCILISLCMGRSAQPMCYRAVFLPANSRECVR